MRCFRVIFMFSILLKVLHLPPKKITTGSFTFKLEFTFVKTPTSDKILNIVPGSLEQMAAQSLYREMFLDVFIFHWDGKAAALQL